MVCKRALRPSEEQGAAEVYMILIHNSCKGNDPIIDCAPIAAQAVQLDHMLSTTQSTSLAGDEDGERDTLALGLHRFTRKKQ